MSAINTANRMQPYPQHKALRADAYSVILAWITVPCAILAFVLTNYLPDGVGELAGFALFAAFLGLIPIHVALSLMHRCPNCDKHPTIQGFKPVHPKTKSENGLNGWSRVVWTCFEIDRFGASTAVASLSRAMSLRMGLRPHNRLPCVSAKSAGLPAARGFEVKWGEHA